MLTTVRVLRVLVGLVAAWQVVGLLPVLTNWLPNLQNVTGGMWAIAFVKALIMLLCGGIYWWLGTVKNRIDGSESSTSEGRIVIFAVLALVAVGIALAIALPAFSDRGPEVVSTPAEDALQPTYDSKGWTEESTGIDIIDPFKEAPPPGTRYYRNAQGIIYRVYPPGVRPDLLSANPFGLGDSTVGAPPRH